MPNASCGKNGIGDNKVSQYVQLIEETQQFVSFTTYVQALASINKGVQALPINQLNGDKCSN